MDLLERFAHGDIDAFETVFREFQAEVFGWIVRVVRDPATAEDLTIETFWRAYRAHARFDPRRGFQGWARRIATRLAFDHLRQVRREAVLIAEVADTGAAQDTMADGTDAAVRCAFASLPPKLRGVAELALIEERPYSEIAKTLDISPAAVKSRVFRAVRLLRQRLRRLGVKP